MKIAFIGPESSGKTSIALELSKKFNGVFIPEFARDYLDLKPQNYKYEIGDLIHIAEKQFESFHSYQNTNQYIFIDTEMLVMKIWAMDKFGYCPLEIENLLNQQKVDFYLLCKPDFPWQPDPLREDKERRDIIFNKYVDELERKNIFYHVLSGDFQLRVKKIELILQHD